MKYALVTGGSRGIGRAVSIKLASMGYCTVINYRSNDEEAKATLRLIREAGGDGELLPFDVSDGIEVGVALGDWEKRHPDSYVEVVVNNAGIRRDNAMALMPDEDWAAVVDTSLRGFFNVTRPLLQPMLANRHGRIVNMASVSGQKGMPGQTNYSAAKGGLIAATKALAIEVARRGVTVNAVAPGFIQTEMLDGLDTESIRKTIPAQRLGTPEEVAELVAFLVSPAAAYITGNVVSINGGLYT